MYPVSEAYKNWIYNNNSPEGRIFDISGYIDAPFGRVDIDPADLVAGSVKLEDATISSDSLEVGSVFSAGLSFSVYNNKPEYSDISFNGCEASFSVGYKLESGVLEWVPLGQFIIIESSVPANTISFRALDKMILLSSIKWADINVVFPATVREIANACFSAAALPPLPADSFLHDDYVVDAAFTDDNFTARDIVSYCAQIAGCYAKIDRSGTPKFGWYGDIRTPVYYNLNANEDEITGLGTEDGALKVLSGGYEEQDESFYSIGLDDRIDFRVSGSTIYVTGILYEHGEESRLYGRREYLIVLEDNPLVQENMDNVMSAIYEKIGRFAYIPYESKIFGDPAREAGDLVTILHKDGTEYHTIITNISYTFRGESSIEARGASNTVNNIQGYSVKKISSALKEIKQADYDFTDMEKAINSSTNLIANMLGGYAIQTDDAFYVADNANLALAEKVWKWGIGGFGYSENGVDGPYATSVTAEGTIIAKLIQAGLVTADDIKTGNLIIGGANGVNSLKVINPINGETIVEINENGINVDGRIGATGFAATAETYGWDVSARFWQDEFYVDFWRDTRTITYLGCSYVSATGVTGTVHYLVGGENGFSFGAAFDFYNDYYGYGSNNQMSMNCPLIPNTDNAYNLGKSGYRWKQLFAATSTISTSDRRLKKDITPLSDKAFEFIGMVKPVSYKFIDGESGRDHFGFIAQDVEETLKELGFDFGGFIKAPKIVDVIDDEGDKVGERTIEGEYEYMLRYEEFIAPLYLGVQKLIDQNKAQEQRINDLEARIARLEKLIGGTK